MQQPCCSRREERKNLAAVELFFKEEAKQQKRQMRRNRGGTSQAGASSASRDSDEREEEVGDCEAGSSVDEACEAVGALALEEAQERLASVVQASGQHSQRRVRTRAKVSSNAVSRFDLVSGALNLAKRWTSEASVMAPIVTSFTGVAEVGLDGGGLSFELLTSFFESAFDPDEGLFTLPEGAADDSRMLQDDALVLPAPLGSTARSCDDFVAFGRLLIKAKVDAVPVPNVLAPSFWKYIRDPEMLGQDALGIDDLRAFDPVYAAHLSAFASAPEDEVEAWGVYSNSPGGQDSPGSPVTASSRAEYIDKAIRSKLVEGREGSLAAIREGMRLAAGVFDVACSPTSLATAAQTAALFGSRRLTARDLLSCLDFAASTEPPASRIRPWLEDTVAQYSEHQLAQLLMLLTGLKGIPIGGLRNPEASPPHRIAVLVCDCSACSKALRGAAPHGCEGLPKVSTCFWTCRLPLYSSQQVLGTRLQMAMTWASGFGSE